MRTLFSLSLLVGIVACDAHSPLTVKDPDVPSGPAVNNASFLPYLRVGAISNFAVAYVGAADQSTNAHEGQANLVGLFTDELTDRETFNTRQILNFRDAQPNGNNSIDGIFIDLSYARTQLDVVARKYAQLAPKDDGRAEMLALSAFTYILFAENYCSGVPFSTENDDGSITHGPPLTTNNMLDTAIAKLKAAQTIAAGNTSTDPLADTLIFLGDVGIGRALLDEGNAADAAAAVANVPASFSYQMLESTNTTRQENGVWNYTGPTSQAFTFFSVADRQGGVGLPFATALDPRVPSFVNGTGERGTGPFYSQTKYPAPDSPMPVADYREAQLITAEAKLVSGDYAGAKAILDALRATVGLGPLAAAATPHDQIIQIITERAYWQYLTAHRLGDWRRVARPPYSQAPYNVQISDVFPTGPGYFGIYELPVPANVSQNPLYHPCSTGQP